MSSLEVANVHGFSSGLFGFVIVPRAARRQHPPSPLLWAAVLVALLLIPAAPRHRLVGAPRAAYLTAAALALGFFLVAQSAGVFSPFRIWISMQAFVACVIVLYCPALADGLVAAVRRTSAFSWLSSARRRQEALRILYVYVASTMLFLVSVLGRYETGTGFTRLIRFGDQFQDRVLPAVRDVPHAVLPHSFGYDGQFYAQLAVDPLLRDPGIDRALDMVPYRARRILFSWTAYVLGLGQPRWVLQAYALQGAISWLLLAVILLHWMPPVSLRSFGLWFGCMFGHGAIISVMSALPDGPSLLVVSLALLALDRGRPLAGAALIGLAGLGKETNLLSSGATVTPGRRSPLATRRDRGVVAGRRRAVPPLVATCGLRIICFRGLLQAATFRGHWSATGSNGPIPSTSCRGRGGRRAWPTACSPSSA